MATYWSPVLLVLLFTAFRAALTVFQVSYGAQHRAATNTATHKVDNNLCYAHVHEAHCDFDLILAVDLAVGSGGASMLVFFLDLHMCINNILRELLCEEPK